MANTLNNQPTTGATGDLAAMLATLSPADRAAALATLLGSTAATPLADTRTPAQQAADTSPAATPGLRTGAAGQPATSPNFNYATSAVVAGRGYRTNAAGLQVGLLALATLVGQPATHPTILQAAKALGARYTADMAWCASRDLADIGLATASQHGNRKGIQVSAAGLAHVAALQAAAQHYGRAVWVCPFANLALCASTAADLGPWPLAATPAPEVPDTADTLAGGLVAAEPGTPWRAPVAPAAIASNAYSAACAAAETPNPFAGAPLLAPQAPEPVNPPAPGGKGPKVPAKPRKAAK